MNNRNLLTVLTIGLWLIVAPLSYGEEASTDNGEPDWISEIRVGVVKHDVDNLWSGTSKENGIGYNLEIIFGRPHFSFLSGLVRPNLGVTINDSGDTSKLYAGLLWELETKYGIFIDLGIGAAVHNGKLQTSDNNKKELGSRVLFRIPIEIGYALNAHHRISIAFDHISNAYLANPNAGLDTLGIRYGYRF
jgi:hypothetical protein